jgi:hypothetical protein
MRSLGLMVALLLVFLVAGPAGAADRIDPLTRARLLYNQKEFEAAVSAAEEARRTMPARADSADLISARAYVERYRISSDTSDLTNARDRLRRIDVSRLPAAERLEYLVGVGETLYFEDSIGAAAEVFDSVLARTYLTPEARERVLDWWATALDRDARQRNDVERQGIYLKVRERMRSELGLNPASATASYWLAAAARNQGDWRAAWDAAQAGWLRALLSPDRGIALRADLDQLMDIGILPARARAQAQPVELLRVEWDEFKARWE